MTRKRVHFSVEPTTCGINFQSVHYKTIIRTATAASDTDPTSTTSNPGVAMLSRYLTAAVRPCVRLALGGPAVLANRHIQTNPGCSARVSAILRMIEKSVDATAKTIGTGQKEKGLQDELKRQLEGGGWSVDSEVVHKPSKRRADLIATFWTHGRSFKVLLELKAGTDRGWRSKDVNQLVAYSEIFPADLHCIVKFGNTPSTDIAVLGQDETLIPIDPHRRASYNDRKPQRRHGRRTSHGSQQNSSKKKVSTKQGSTTKVSTKKVSTTKVSTTKVSTEKVSTKKASTTKASTTKVSTTKVSTTTVSTTKVSTTKVSRLTGVEAQGASS
jgi:hypothetical protein